MSDTPRTDAAAWWPRYPIQEDEAVDADFARQLERELAVLRKTVQMYALVYAQHDAAHALSEVDDMRRAHEEGK